MLHLIMTAQELYVIAYSCLAALGYGLISQ